jgi:hypothetical protein
VLSHSGLQDLQDPGVLPALLEWPKLSNVKSCLVFLRLCLVNAVCLGLKSNANDNELDSCMTRGQILFVFCKVSTFSLD